jgi:hypothetical protein
MGELETGQQEPSCTHSSVTGKAARTDAAKIERLAAHRLL